MALTLKPFAPPKPQANKQAKGPSGVSGTLGPGATTPTQRKQATAIAHPTQPGVQKYLPSPPKTNKGGRRLPPQQRQKVRERNLVQVVLNRRKLALQAAGKPPKIGPPQPASKAPTESNRSALNRELQLARQANRQDKTPHTAAAMGLANVPGLGPAINAVGGQVGKELSGKGLLMGAGEWLAKHSAQSDTVIPALRPIAKITDNAIKDLVELPANALPSVYIPAKAGIKAAEGKPQELKALWKQIKTTDPVALAAQGKVGKAVKAAGQHPVYTLLEGRGVKAVAGRTAGATMRAIPGKTREIASTKRAPLQVHGNITEPRSYSKDVLTKAYQVSRENRKVKKGFDPNQASPGQVSAKLKRRVDEQVAAVEGNRRANRAKVMQAWQGKNTPHPATPFAVQAIARSPKTLWNDIAAYRNHLKSIDPATLSKAERAANRQLIQQAEKAIKTGGDPKAIFAEAKAYNKAHAPMISQLVKTSDLEAGQVRAARLVPYARLHMGAKWDTAAKSLTTADGNPLTAGQIEAHMRENGVKVPGFISQQPNFRGSKNYFLNFQTPKHRVAGKTRTGEATMKGTFDASPLTMGEQLVRSQGYADAIAGFDHTMKTFGTRPAKGKYYPDTATARTAAENLTHDHNGNPISDSVELVPVRIAPFAANKSTLAKIKTGHESSGSLAPLADMESSAHKISTIVDESMRPGPGPVVLVPKVVMDRLRAHNSVSSTTGGKAMGAVSTAFKTTVLPTSVKWLAGNAIDPGIRSAMEGVTPLDPVLGMKIFKAIKKIDPKAAQEFEVRALGGMHLASVAKTAKHREASQFAGTALEWPAKAIGKARREPVIKQMVDGYQHYAGKVFNLNSRMERTYQYSVLGKEARRQVQETRGAWHKAIALGPKTIEDLANGLLDTNSQVAMGRAIDRVLGQWDKNGPTARRFMIDYAPFGQWWRAASKYVMVTFPKDHPIKVAMLAALTNMTEQERKAVGLTKGPGGVPGFLQGSIPTKKGLIPFGGYSSFGMFSQYPENSGSMILPWLPLDQLRGINFKGNQIRNSDGSDLTDPQRIALAGYSMLESIMPLTAVARRLQEGGGTSTDFSTVFKPKVKAGTKGNFGDAANKVFNPFRPSTSNVKSQSTGGFDWSQATGNPQVSSGFDWSKAK